MKVRLPKSFVDLPQREKEIIERVKQEEIQRIVNENFANVQKAWLQLACVVLADYLGHSVEECMLFLANFREVYRLNGGFSDEETRSAWLTEKVNTIFGGNYPYEYIEKLADMG